MKKLLTAVCTTLALMLSPAWAQMADDPSVLLAKIQADKKGVVEKSLNLTAAEAKKFWPLYEKFQRELDVPHREYALAVRDYVAAEKSMTDANATRLARAVLAASVTEAKMREKHFKEVVEGPAGHQGRALRPDREQDPGHPALRNREGDSARVLRPARPVRTGRPGSPRSPASVRPSCSSRRDRARPRAPSAAAPR